MRPLVWVLRIVVGVTLLASTNQVSAAHGKNNSNKSNIHGKHNSRTLKKVATQNPGDIWERIRSGMQIPLPSLFHEVLPTPRATQPETASSALTSVKTLINKRSGLPMRMDKINALLSAAATHKPEPNLSAKDHQDLIAIQKANISGATRYRTVIGFHPELQKQIAKQPLKPIIKVFTGSKILPLADNRANSTIRSPDCVAPKAENLNEGGQLPIPNEIKVPATTDPCVSATKNIDRVNKQIAWYAQRPDFVRQVAERSRPYIFHIVDKLSKNKLPLELALLPIVESAYQPTALSPKSAAGLWQFIPSTGKDFDLQQSDYYDDRLDIMASTQAAVRFLSGLRQHFNGDWLLALAAYNCGQGAVDAAIAYNSAEGLPTDFWSLPLPEETQNYVPRLLAVSSIFATPDKYNIKLPMVRNEPYFVQVKVDQYNDIKLLSGKNMTTVAQLANLNIDTFSLLNPGYTRLNLPNTNSYSFLIPVTHANHLHKGLANLARIRMDIENKAAAFSPILSTLMKAPSLPKFSTPILSLDMDGSQSPSPHVKPSLSSIL